MNAKPTALDAYLPGQPASTPSWNGGNNSPTTTSVTTSMPSIGVTSAISGGWRQAGLDELLAIFGSDSE